MNNRNTRNPEHAEQSSKLLQRLINSTGIQISIGIGAALLLWACCRLVIPTKKTLTQTSNSSPIAAVQKAPQAQITPAGFEKTKVASSPSPGTTPEGMVWVPGGTFSMGCQDPGEYRTVETSRWLMLGLFIL